MMKPEWPGIATAVGIVLVLVLVVVGSRDDFHLKDWQTLIAGSFALLGGALAYRGAMANVKQEGDLQRRKLLRRQLSLYLKLDITIRNFRDKVVERESKISFANSGDRVQVGEIRLIEPPEIEEAWDNLDVFPRRLIREIASIRESIHRLNVLLDPLVDGDELIAGDTGSGVRLDLAQEQIGAVSDACGIIADGLAPEIEQLAPPMSQNDRMIAVYGVQDD